MVLFLYYSAYLIYYEISYGNNYCQGHGKSDGDRCHVEDFQHYTDDLLHYVEIVTSQLDKEYPVFLLGHSMGGLIAIQTALQTPTFVIFILTLQNDT